MDQSISTPSNPRLSIGEALIPLIFLVALLAINVMVFGDDALSGSNQFSLLLAAGVAGIVGAFNGVGYKAMMAEVAENLQSTSSAIFILLMVGALAGSWMISGIIPTLIHLGIQVLNPQVFLAASVIICSVISVATGSSWTTSATVGIALIGIGKALGLPPGMVAGAVISGAYFGDKMSPLSDTTNLAAAMTGADLFSHIRYMMYTTVPTIIITLVVFIILGLGQSSDGVVDSSSILHTLEETFNISYWLLLVPVIIVVLIIKKTKPLVALMIGVLLGGVFALIFQPHIVKDIAGSETLDLATAYKGIMTAFTTDVSIDSGDPSLNDLFSSGGMSGMMGTIWLIICAMCFGGVMDAIGALSRISEFLLSLAKSSFSLIASTVASCLALNVTASDQYLTLVVSGKMFSKAYEEKGLAPENLSRTMEDAGTVSSVLIPWNTCGAFQSGVLGVSVAEYFIYAIFNYLSLVTTLIVALFGIKIKKLTTS